MKSIYAEVIVPLPLHDYFTYRVPEHLVHSVKTGIRVIIQFGPKKYFSAIVVSLSEHAPQGIEIKDILEVLDEIPVAHAVNFELWKWMAGYYCCTIGDVFKAALPTGLKLESNAEIALTDEMVENHLSPKAEAIVQALKTNSKTLSEIQKKLGRHFSFSALKSLIENGIVVVDEKIEKRYKPKLLPTIAFHPQITSEEILNDKISLLKKARKQTELLLHFCQLTNAFGSNPISEILKKDLSSHPSFSNESLNGLIKKEILKLDVIPVSRLEKRITENAKINALNNFQETALQEIKTRFETKNAVLLHGVTASGKTEIYIHLIDEMLKLGKQVLYLLPEISLTSQITSRLSRVFGAKAGIYHSKMSDSERVEVWQKVIASGENPEMGYQVVLGARSSLFLPFRNLGLIIVDEEHETTYKQQDPAPRYHARDSAVMAGQVYKAKVLLGSATPSVESYFNALNGKYGLVNLSKRHSETELPEIIVSDLRQARKKKQMTSVLAKTLYIEMQTTLKNGEQVILFQNRRGYSPFTQCNQCGYVPKCVRCDVSLTYHKSGNSLICHYCGHKTFYPEKCPQCNEGILTTKGFGTEKVEDELKPLFPQARIDRMDIDNTHSKTAFDRIISNLENRVTDILIGTQMVTKGLDFDHVRLVGILNADSLVNFPDFRAHERAFQLISQVSGRAGRKNRRGKVIIQTTNPDLPLLQLIIHNDFETFYTLQAGERLMFRYPPYYRLIKITVRHREIDWVNHVSTTLSVWLKNISGVIVLGPEFPLVSRIQLLFLKEIWLKIKRDENQSTLKNQVFNTVNTFKSEFHINHGCIVFDVDPV